MRLKELRASMRLTQDQLADMLKTTQQTIARWESGKAEPSIAVLRDLAMIFGTSVDELLGKTGTDKITSTRMHYFLGDVEDADGYWGNIGVKLRNGAHTHWFPITLKEVNRVSRNLKLISEGESAWVTCSTLNNKMLAINAKNVQRIWFLDEACDETDDWELDWDSLEGNPLELYQALEDHTYEPDHLKETSSETLYSLVEETIKEFELSEEDIARATTDTLIRFVDGTSVHYPVKEKQLWNLANLVERDAVPTMLELDNTYGNFESLYSANELAVVEMPLLKVRRGADETAAQLAAEEKAPKASPRSRKNG